MTIYQKHYTMKLKQEINPELYVQLYMFNI